MKHPLLLTGLLMWATASAEIRLYEVDPMIQGEVSTALQSMMSWPASEQDTESRLSGVIRSLPSGQLVVNTDEKTHQQIASVLKQVAEKNVDISPTMRINYWLVFGADEGASDSSNALPTLRPAIDQLNELHPDLSYRQLDYAQITSQSGHRANFSSDNFTILQDLINNGQSAVGTIELSYETDQRQRISMSLTIQPGEYVVLSQNSSRVDDQPGYMFYIVHWPQDH